MIRSMSSRSSTSWRSSAAASWSSCARWSVSSRTARRIASSARCCCSASRSSRVRSETAPPSAVELQRADRRAHRPLVDHRARDRRDPLEVVGGAGGDAAEDHLLRRAAAEQDRHLVHQLGPRLEVAVLFREVQRVAERRCRAGRSRPCACGRRRAAARSSSAWPASWKAITRRSCSVSARRDCMPATTRSSALSKSSCVEPGAAPAGGGDRGLVGDVGQVGAGQAGGLARDDLEVDVGDRLVARVDLEDRLAAADVGRRDEDLAVEAAGAQQRRVELLEQVGRGDDDEVAAWTRSRPSPPAAG